jgi:hypothetical protein
MKRIPLPTVLFLVTALLMAMLAGFTGVSLAQTDTPDTIQEGTPVPATDTPDTSQEGTPVPPTDEPEPEKTNTPEFYPTFTPTPIRAATVSEGEEPPSTKELFTLEGPVSQWVSDLAAQYGWDQIFFLGLSVEDWINVALSILFFILIYIFGRWLRGR